MAVRGVLANICSFVKRMGPDTALHAVARLSAKMKSSIYPGRI